MEIGSRKRKSLDAATDTVGPEESAREAVRQRFQAELAAVSRLLKKAAAMPAPRSEERPPAKRSKKASPPPDVIKRKKMTQGERDILAEDLVKLVAELPDHIVKLLEKQNRGETGSGVIEIDIHADEDEAILELRKQLDEFVRERADQEHQGGKTMAHEEEEEEDVDIVGGVSPLTIAQEGDEYVDICGDASPVAMQKNLGGSPSSSSSSSDSDSDSDSDSATDSSGSDSDSDDESVDGPAPEERAKERQRKEARCRAREKARQDALETERTAMPSDTIDPTVLKTLRIREYGVLSLFRLLGLFLKADDDQEEQHLQFSQEEELEEGEIRF